MTPLDRTDLINRILRGPSVKLVPSSIAGAGVGVVTLTEIRSGQVVFAPRHNHFVRWSELAGLPDSVTGYVKQICNHDAEGFHLDCHLNEVGAAYFVNHSLKPNLTHDRGSDVYYAARDIRIGEELTCVYDPDEIDWV
jgi:hypothetical protein